MPREIMRTRYTGKAKGVLLDSNGIGGNCLIVQYSGRELNVDLVLIPSLLQSNISKRTPLYYRQRVFFCKYTKLIFKINNPYCNNIIGTTFVIIVTHLDLLRCSYFIEGFALYVNH